MELQNDDYKKLLKEADDNNAIVRIIRWFVFLIILIIFMGVYGCHAIDMVKQREAANTAVAIREIESSGLEFDEYIEWLNAKGGNE